MIVEELVEWLSELPPMAEVRIDFQPSSPMCNVVTEAKWLSQASEESGGYERSSEGTVYLIGRESGVEYASPQVFGGGRQ